MPINELDLLALIEGDLPADRREAVLTALARDPALRARVDAMRADRDLLRSLPSVHAPRGLVAMAVESAEREELLGVAMDAAPAVAGRIGLPGWTRGLAAAAALLLVAGGGMLVWSVLGPTTPSQIGGGAAEQFAEASSDAPIEAGIGPALALDSSAAKASDDTRLAGATQSTRARAGVPLGDAIREIDRHDIDWAGSGPSHLTLVIAPTGDEPHPATLSPIPQVTAASFDDAIRLASVGRLTLRVRAADAAAARSALQEFGGRGANDVMLVSEEPRGTARYEVEMARADCDFAELLGALHTGGNADTQAFFDVALLPTQADRSFDAFAAPRQVTSGEPRVGLQVLIEPKVY